MSDSSKDFVWKAFLRQTLYAEDDLQRVPSGNKMEIVNAANRRWHVTLYIKVNMDDLPDGQWAMLVIHWKKPTFNLTKDQRMEVLTELERIGLTKILTQETLAHMLNTTNSTIQKSLSDLKKADLVGSPS